MGRGSRHGLNRDEWQVRAREFAPRGEDCSSAKLSATLVRDIRATIGKITNRAWAERLSVSKRCIERIRAYETWVHIR